MAQFLTDKYLKYRAALDRRPIEGDRQCDQCGYNVKGLTFGGRCPECGTPIRYRRDPTFWFDELPLTLIRRFRRSCLLATVTLFGMMALASVRFQAATPGSGTALLAGIGLWVYAAWRLTEPFDHPRAASRGLGHLSRLRRAARWLQLAWLVVAGAVAVAATPQGMPLLWATGLLGLAGLVCLVLYLGRIASWVRDDFAEKAFDLSVFGTVLGSGLSLIITGLGFALGGFAINFVPFMLVLSLGLTVASLLAFPVGLLSLSRSVRWSARHARARQERSDEVAQRMAPRPDPTPASTVPIPLAGESADPPSRKSTGTQEQEEAR